MRLVFVAASAAVLLTTASLHAQAGPREGARARSSAPRPITVAEASGFTRTANAAELRSFLDAILALAAPGRLRIESFGTTEEGREMLAVRVPTTAAVTAEDPPLRVLVVANIHAGEVCGKEAVQLLLREIATGEHGDLTAACEFCFVPNYNADGNEVMDPRHRPSQNGPIAGMGKRENVKGLDLNRDCVKAESAEFRAPLGLFRDFDPHVAFDLHTTNGSPHGYHVTYASSMSTNVDAQIDQYARAELIPAMRTRLLERHGFRSFDYGNVERGPTPVWATFDHLPRYLTNYIGLRNRISLLSEAYAYDPFETRVRSTRAFVIESLRCLVADRQKVIALCRAADRACSEGAAEVMFHWDTKLADGEEQDVLMGTWDDVPLEGGGRRLTRRTEFEPRRMLVKTRFASLSTRALPAGGWALAAPGVAVLENLRAHGVVMRTLAAPMTTKVRAFVPTSGDRATRAFQGHRTLTLRGEWHDAERELPAGTVVIPSRQPLARLAAQLLEPESEDGLATWEFFASATTIAREGQPGSYPVLHLPSLDHLQLR